VKDRRLLAALVDLAAVALMYLAQREPELFTRARAFRAGASTAGRLSTVLYRTANRASTLSLQLDAAYRREVS